MKKKMQYKQPLVVDYGSVYGLTRGHFKVFGPGDGVILVDNDGNVVGIGDAPSAFH